MKQKLSILFAVFACLALLMACGSGSTESSKLEPYSKAALKPGKGLGELELGKTKLGWFLGNIGIGAPSVLITDEKRAIELTFLKGEVSFLFIVTGACEEAAGVRQIRLNAGGDIQAFIKQYPACGEIPLSSISVAAGGENFSGTFFKGITDLGAQLLSPVSEVYKLHGKPVPAPGQIVAGEAGTENFQRLEYPSGIYFYYFKGKGPTADEVRSGSKISPERMGQIANSGVEASKDLRVKRITVFIPDSN